MKNNHLHLLDFDFVSGKFQIPCVFPETVCVQRLVAFNKIRSFQEVTKNIGVHFFLDDYQFERVWNKPERYAKMLAGFACVLSPDFSMYADMPLAMQIWNHYRKMAVSQVLQNQGITVVPTLNWSTEESFQFCFDGMPKNGTIAVSSVGCCKNSSVREKWTRGMNEAVGRLKPKTILFYGSPIEFQNQGSEVVYFQPEHLQRVRKIRKGKIEVGERTKWLMENPAIVCYVAEDKISKTFRHSSIAPTISDSSCAGIYFTTHTEKSRTPKTEFTEILSRPFPSSVTKSVNPVEFFTS
ncbi:MAG: DUF4417 domain-containing protein [Planctomycetia bacterium]|nr:DUF4417 domain-containing protein [Planctomycetia bacterium]